MPPISIRCKRKDTTVFLVCDASDTFNKVRTRLAVLLGARTVADVKLFAEDTQKEFLDDAILSDFGLNDESIIHFSIAGDAVDGKPHS